MRNFENKQREFAETYEHATGVCHSFPKNGLVGFSPSKRSLTLYTCGYAQNDLAGLEDNFSDCRITKNKVNGGRNDPPRNASEA